MENTLLNLVPASYLPEVHLSQYDVGRELKFTLKDGSSDYTVPSGAVVTVKATKPSGLGFVVNAVAEGSVVTLSNTETMTNENGRFPAELSITQGSTVIGTSNFIFNIERSPHPEGTIDGDAESLLPELTLLVERVEAAASSILDMEVEAETLPAGSQASYSYDEELNKATFGIPQGEPGAGAVGTVASAYDASKTYAVGDYAIHDNNLYRCITAITTAEAFTVSHWTRIVLVDDVTDLKSDLKEATKYEYIDLLNDATFEIGSLATNTGGETPSTTRIRSKYIDISNVKHIRITPQNGYKYVVYCYDSNKTWVGNNYGGYYNITSWNSSGKTLNIIPKVAYIRVLIADTSDSESISVADKNKVSMLADYPLYDNQENAESLTNFFYAWLNGSESVETPKDWDNGVVNAGTNQINVSATRIWSGVIEIPPIDGTIELKADTGYNLAYYLFDESFANVKQAFWTNAYSIEILESYKYIIIAESTTDNSNISPSAGNNAHISFKPKNALKKTIPSYFADDIANGIQTTKENIMGTGIDGDSFVFITDLHWQSNSKNSPALIEKIVNDTNVNKIICGGDLIYGGSKATQLTLITDCVNSFKDITRFYTLLGNHDTNHIGAGSASDYFTKSEVYALTQKQSDFVMNYGNPCYFFFDNPTTKTRFICLDTGEEGTTLDTTQHNWLLATLDSMPSNYHALIFAHIILQPKDTWKIGITLADLEVTPFMTTVCGICDTFNGSHIDKKVEAIFGGHVHTDCNLDTSSGIPIVLTDCDARQTFTETSAGSGIANDAQGTVNEQCFDVINIDYTNKVIKCVRVGRGSDRTISY